jgi:hypothetical protein
LSVSLASMSLAGPTATVRAGLVDLDVGELIGQGWGEFCCGNVVVAGFAHVRVWGHALAVTCHGRPRRAPAREG